MITLVALFLATLFLAYSNGANDNFKGVATLFGSGTTDYRQALRWATATTLAGSLCSLLLANALLESFSGKGLIPDAIAGSAEFMIAVALGAGGTVILATLLGFPVSTTHGLTGALVGAGVMAVGSQVNFSLLGSKFFLPLLVSPLLALALGASVYVGLHRWRVRKGITHEWCVCVGGQESLVPAPSSAALVTRSAVTLPHVAVNSTESCNLQYQGGVFGMNVQRLLDCLHYLSAGAVCFARGLNDTPKIVALLLSIKAIDIEVSMAFIASAMAIGGLLSARKVAQTMGKRITQMNHGQGFAANFTTAALVIFASNWGVPVSTTHVSVGSLFGIGLITGKGDKSVMTNIVLSWLLTLPIAATLAGGVYWSIAS